MLVTFDHILNFLLRSVKRVLNEYTVVVLVNLIAIGTMIFRLFIVESDSCFSTILLTVAIREVLIQVNRFDYIVNVLFNLISIAEVLFLFTLFALLPLPQLS